MRRHLTRWGLQLAIGVGVFGALPGVCCAQEAPSTQPSEPMVLNAVNLVERLQARVQALQLTGEQQSRVANIFEVATRQANELENQLENASTTERLQNVLLFMRDVRLRLMEVLTPRQITDLWGSAATRPSAERPGTQPPNFQVPGLPGVGRGGIGAGGVIPLLIYISDALPKLNLPDDEHDKVVDLMTQTMKQAEEIRARMAAGENVQNGGRMLVTNFRDKLFALLTPEQRVKLRDLIEKEQPLEDRPDAPPPASRTEQVAPSSGPKEMTPEMSADASKGSDAAAAASTPDKSLSAADETGGFAKPGSVAPAFALSTPGNVIVNLTRFKGRVLVLYFGSITSPTFRDHLVAMQKLAQKYTDRAFFLIVYTREVHPSGGWEVVRNQNDGFSVQQPADYAARLALADKAQSEMNITLPMVVDKMDDAVTKAYGGFPNAAVVIGRDGKIAGRQQWADPSGLPRLIDKALGKE